VASALCFGSMALFARAAYDAGVDPPTLLLLRFAIAALLIWGAFVASGASLPRGRTLAVLVAMGAVGYAGQAFCYFGALTQASAGLVALLLYLYPAIVTVLSRVALGHVLTPLHVAAVAVALLGSVLTIGEAGDGTPLGILLGLAGSLVYSVYILAGSRLPRTVSPTASTAVITSSAGAVYLGVAAVRGLRLPSTAAGWGAVLAIAVVCTVLAVALFLAGLERVGPVRASLYSTVEPVFTVALAALLLGESVGAARLLGGALILGAVLLIARADLRAATAPAREAA
jgi:drug/metabolite transporter (DMT)-like permease